MLLKITTTHRPATDLGWLLAKNPERPQSFELSFGRAHVFYPEATEERCSAVLLLDIDPVALVRGRGDADGPLTQYVNDRPFTASSFMAVAIAQVFGSALGGRSKSRAEVAAAAIPLEIEIPVLRCRGGEGFLRRCFEPIGHDVEVRAVPLDERFSEWGESPYLHVVLRSRLRLCEALSHLYVLLPALDGEKHYFVGNDEVDKLVEKGAEWLAAHPERDAILRAYLKRRRSLVAEALGKLLAQPEAELETAQVQQEGDEQALERRVGLNEQRLAAVQDVLLRAGARSVVDLGCGEGRLLARLLDHRQFERLLGIEVSCVALERAAERLHLDRLPPLKRARIDLQQGSLTYRDARIAGFDAACAIEVIEHMDEPRLPAFERTVFGHAKPHMVVITTPNVEYNARFERLPAGAFRHRDHRFEWTRAQFREWADGVCGRHGYAVEMLPIGPEDAGLGAPTQMAVFTR